MAHKDLEKYLFDEYKLKHEYVVKQYDRLWQRFNYFLTIQTGLVGAVGLQLSGGLQIELLVIFVFGFLISALWYVVAKQDQYLVTNYRHRVENCAKRLDGIVVGLNLEATFAARKSDMKKTDKQPDETKDLKVDGLFSGYWYSETYSITKMPIVISALTSVAWGISCAVAVASMN